MTETKRRGDKSMKEKVEEPKAKEIEKRVN
jgi:hypothetical protein